MDADGLTAAKTLWDYHAIYDDLEPSDVIVGLGSYDLRVVDRCAELFQDGLAQRIIFTGATGNWTDGLYDTSEAAAFANHAIALGVPADAISLEEQATNIGENIALTARMLGQNERCVIFVTKPQTQRRVVASVPMHAPDLQSVVTAPLHTFSQQPTGRHDMAALISEMVGDVWRMRAYPALDFQVSQPIPDEVSAAFDVLTKAGFMAHLPDNWHAIGPV